MNTSKKRLAALRKEMKARSIDACVIPATDPHLGEYVPTHWKIVSWLTGFTGSAATVVVTRSFAGVWTDSRYFIQAGEELSGSGFELVKLKIPHTPEYIEWLAGSVRKGGTVGFDGRVVSIGLFKQMHKAFGQNRIKIDTGSDLISELWNDRPAMPSSVAFEHPVAYAGLTREVKIGSVRKKMEEMSVDFHLLTSQDDIMWMLNIRGGDVAYCPLLTCFAIVSADQVLLFVNEEQVPANIMRMFDRSGIVMLPYDATAGVLSGLPSGNTLLLNPSTVSTGLYMAVSEGVEIIEDVSIPARLKAIKNSTERSHIRETMIKDGVALTRFFHWLEGTVGRERVTEMSAAARLLEFRMEQEGCRGESFATIAAWNEHAALPHYSPSVERDTELGPNGIFLLDSGGQYTGGTTDVTRCVVFGNPTARQRMDFTLALKGTMALARAKFPLGTRGYQIEVLARKALWEHGLNYGHGTGHGVGFYLNVHEGPQTIGTGASGDLKTILEPGMLTADEPAIYRTGEYGFRTENLILCVEDELTGFGQFLKFETVTLCYIDRRLIEKSLLDMAEIEWIDKYHHRVYELLEPHLDNNMKQWLNQKTAPL